MQNYILVQIKKLKKGQKICDWDPYTVPVIAETSGIANYVDLVDAVSIADKTDETTGISSKIVLRLEISIKKFRFETREHFERYKR